MAKHVPVNPALAASRVFVAVPEEIDNDVLHLVEDGLVEDQGNEEVCQHCPKNMPDER